MNPGPESVNNVVLVVGLPRARDLETSLIQPREKQLQHSVSPPYSEEELKLVERVAAMYATLLLQVVHRYP
jgi:hypothetical protein